MQETPVTTLAEHFGDLEDARADSVSHRMLDMIVMAICAVICGADTWVEVEIFGKAKRDWLNHFLELPHGIPSHDTFGRVLWLLDADAFRDCFVDWVEAISDLMDGEVGAIDGKNSRRSHDRTIGKEAIELVGAWTSDNRLVLGHEKVDDESNEITAVPPLLELLALTGCIVTVDAIGCQTTIAEKIIDADADYVLLLKQNQERLYGIIEDRFNDPDEMDAVRSHREIENKVHWVLDVAFREDESRVRQGNAAQNLSLLRHIALNLLKQEKTAQCGTKAKRLKARRDPDYLLKVVSG